MHVRPILTLEAYFALEEAETVHRHEYWDGDLWAMTGTTPEHNDLVLHLVGQLRAALEGGDCRAYAESIRTRIEGAKYVYPDIVVACPPRFDRRRKPPTLENPKVIVEVLSESTASFDRGDKLEAYQRLASVFEVVLVASDLVDVVHHTRLDDGWHRRSVSVTEPLTLPSVGVDLDLAAAYRVAGLI